MLCLLVADLAQRGLVSVEYDNTQQSKALTSTPKQKRKLGDTDFEIADSDEDYGWDDDDEELPPMPSQWQGSEDLLLTLKPESDDEDDQDDHKSLDAGEDDGPEPDGTNISTEANRSDRATIPE
jgi:hypothetical protein